jgi:hypothetical protein
MSPVVGLSASPSALRWPSVYTSARAFGLPANGLSFGTLPSSLKRSTLPPSEFGFCGSFGSPGPDVVVTNSVPSLPNAILVVPAFGATQISFTSLSAWPSNFPRATATTRRFSSSGLV